MAKINSVPMKPIELVDNPKIVDDSGYVPLQTLISRFERSGELKQMYERLSNPNCSIDKVIQDFSMLEQSGDSLEVMAFAKNAMDRIKISNPEAYKAYSSVPTGRGGTEELANSLCDKL